MTKRLTETAENILSKRYYRENETCWAHLVERVAGFFAKDDSEYSRFYEMMYELDALPNSPTLMNAGTEITSYSACYCLEVGDSIESIYKYYKDAALISKSGGGVGANFSSIRAEGSLVGETGGVASGPLSFMNVQDTSTETIKQGGRRKGANMAILDCNHPDIWKFVKAKDTPKVLENFNLSVRFSDRFMEEVAIWDKSGIQTEDTTLWDEVCQRAWNSAEPGVLFGDTIERGNVTPHLGELKQTNPCSEQPLLPFESCTLLSINLANHLQYVTGPDGYDKGIDWDKLKETTETAVLFMNRVLDKSVFPIQECQDAMDLTRKIGIGIMGLHDLLIYLKLPYDSEEGRKRAGQIMQYIYNVADQYSEYLGDQEGVYEGWVEGCPKRRNACLTTIAPTGTLSTLCDVASGCEPYYAPLYTRDNIGTTFFMACRPLVEMARDLQSCTEDGYAYSGSESIDGVHKKYIDLILKDNPDLFKSAGEIHWSDHVKIQAVLQNSGVDSSISKTINLPNNATVKDVKDAYELSYRLGCKGVTIYRDGSRSEQVLDVREVGPRDHSQSDSAAALRRGNKETVSSAPTEVSNPMARCVSGESLAKATLPDTLRATRYRVRVKGIKVYILVCEDDTGRPMEVFAKFPFEGGGSWSALCRSISLSMRYGVPLDDIIKQLDKSVAVLNDMPSCLSRILKTYLSGKGGLKGIPCPECGSELVFQEGCEKCICGFSKCG